MTVKCAVALVAALLFAGVLAAAHQNTLRGSRWCTTLILLGLAGGWMIGLGLHFGSFMLPWLAGIAFMLAYIVGWLIVGRRFSGWRQHALRAGVFGVCLGPLLAVRLATLDEARYLWITSEVLPGADMALGEQAIALLRGSPRNLLWALAAGLPGFYLAGAVAFLVSLSHSAVQRWRWPDRRLAIAGLCVFSGLVVTVNWYIAGAINIDRAAMTGDCAKLRYVIWSRPGSANVKNYRGDSPLHYAARHGRTDAVRLLLGSGSTVNSRGEQDETPLHAAVVSGDIESVRALLAAGADPDVCDADGVTALGMVWVGPTRSPAVAELVQTLLNGGARREAIGPKACGAVHLAAAARQHVLIETLIAAGADIRRRDRSGRTALHYVSAGLREDTRDERLPRAAGEAASFPRVRPAALTAAMGKDLPSTVRLLLTAGVPVNARDNAGRTALDLIQSDEVGVLLRAAGGKTGAELDAEQAKPAAQPASPEPGR